MLKTINKDNLKALITSYSDDKETLDIIFSYITKMLDYHKAIFEMELKLKIYSDFWSPEEYRSEYASLDNNRTNCHNGTIAAIGILNKLAEQKGIGLIYDGVVSREQPHRRILADAVFEFMNEIIDNRI